MLATLAFGAPEDFFPLAEGNSWTYRASGNRARGVETISVAGTERIGENSYYLLTAFGRQRVPVRFEANGALLAYDRDRGTESVWMNFAAPVGDSFETVIHPCVASARVEKRDGEVNGPLGPFKGALHIAFVPSCADAGLTEAYFVEGVGLVRYEVTTIAGPVTYELIDSRTGDSQRSSGLTTRLTLDAPVYTVPRGGSAEMVATFAVRNTTGKPLTLSFRSGQRVELAITEAGGQTVYFWSSDKLFHMALGAETLNPNDERTWTLTAPLMNLSAGQYTAKAWLTTSSAPEKAYSASVGFQVADVVIQPEED